MFPPEEPYGSLLVKLRPGVTMLRVCRIVWPGACVSMYSCVIVVRVFATYGISTMIIFDEGEKFETIAVGDTDSWDVVPTDKGNILFVDGHVVLLKSGPEFTTAMSWLRSVDSAVKPNPNPPVPASYRPQPGKASGNPKPTPTPSDARFPPRNC